MIRATKFETNTMQLSFSFFGFLIFLFQIAGASVRAKKLKQALSPFFLLFSFLASIFWRF